jgi:hypothetical protein
MATLGTWMDLKRRKEHKHKLMKLLPCCDVHGELGLGQWII